MVVPSRRHAGEERWTRGVVDLTECSLVDAAAVTVLLDDHRDDAAADRAVRRRGDTDIAPPSGGHGFVIVTDRLPARREDSATVGTAALPDDPVTAELSALARRGDALWIGRRPTLPGSSSGPSAEIVLPSEEARRYEAYARQTLWSLYHAVVHPMVHDRRFRTAYRRVNQRFARAVADRAGTGATVWVHGHHLQLVPGLLRRLRPDVRIGFYLPIPFPSPDLLRVLPMHEEIWLGLLGADLIGFQTDVAADNFRRLRPAVPASDPAFGLGAGTVGVYPFSVDRARIRGLAGRADVRRHGRDVRASLGTTRAVALSIDSADDAPGVVRRLEALGKLFASGQVTPSDLTLIQILVQSDAAPRGVLDEVARQVARVNGDVGAIGRACVHYVVSEPSLDQRVALYLAADVLVATPLRPGPHLPALEYAAARPDDGRLVLSEFIDAAGIIDEAVLINPYDDEDLRRALGTVGRDVRLGRRQPALHRPTGRDHQLWSQAFVDDLRADARPRRALADLVQRRGHVR
jgi:trehalose 6-phosphate synthase